MIEIDNYKVEENAITGYFVSETGNKRIPVTFNIENHSNNPDDFKPLIDKSSGVIKSLVDDRWASLLHEVARELTDSAYGQDGYVPKAEDYQELQNEIFIFRINVYQDTLILVLQANKNYPDMDIYCQVNDDLEMEDLSLYDR